MINSMEITRELPTKIVPEVSEFATEETETTKNKNEELKFRYENAKLDDFVFLGRYTFIVCLLSELLILCQLGNMLYMVYAGLIFIN